MLQGLHHFVPTEPRKEPTIIEAPEESTYKFPTEESLKMKHMIHMAGVEPLVGTSLLDAHQAVSGKQAIEAQPEAEHNHHTQFNLLLAPVLCCNA